MSEQDFKMSEQDFKQGDHALVRHPQDGNWYEVVIEDHIEATGDFLVCVVDNPQSSNWRHSKCPRWLANRSGMRRK